MLKLFIAVFSLILLYWIYKKKGQILVRRKETEPVITTIQASELQTVLDWHTPLQCLQEDGLKFGNKFKKKVPPKLPHTEGCCCQIIEIYYTSAEVFQGGLNEQKKHPSALGQLNGKDAHHLKQMLLGVHEAPEGIEFREFLDAYPIEQFSEQVREDVIGLVEKAFHHYRSQCWYY